jgi:hypothetical protein
MRALLVCLGAMQLVAAGAVGGELLRNAAFDNGLEGWQLWTSRDEPLKVNAELLGGRSVVHFEVSHAPLPAWGRPLSSISQVIHPEASAVLEVRFVLKAEAVRNGWGVYGEVTFLDTAGEQITESRTSGILADGVWQEPVLRVHVPDGTSEVRVGVCLQGVGRVWVDGVTAQVMETIGAEPPEGPVTVTFEGAPLEGRFLGFGFQDDGFIYSRVNRAKGVTDADLRMRERRIRWLDPDLIRTKIWFGGWWPKGPADPRTFTFDSEHMSSLYQTLDLYQELGAAVNITCVEWGVPVFSEPELTSRAIGELFEELIKRRGYTCIEYWTLANEPDITVINRPGITFATLTEVQQLTAREFARRGLNIKVIGSDDANNMGLFERCVHSAEYDATVDVYASHIYLRALERVAIPFQINQRLDLLSRTKPFILAEFGFLDEASTTFSNPFMDTYDFAFYTADLCIRAVNLGVKSLSIWTVQEMYYHGLGDQGRLMACGLWAFKDRDWQVKPVYHAYGMFTRLTKADDPVFVGVSSDPGWIRGVRIGDTLFLVNEAPHPVPVRIEGLAVEALRVYSASTQFSDDECGDLVVLDGGLCSLPPRSFAWAAVPQVP